MIYFKRYFNENTGRELTDAWGTCTYYFETDADGNVSKQMEIFYNSKVLKYSKLAKSDEFGGISLVPLDLEDEGFINISEDEFSDLWERSSSNAYLYNPFRISNFWKLNWARHNNAMSEAQIKKLETILALTSFDNRFVLQIEYKTEHQKFSLLIKEGSVVIFYQQFKTWKEIIFDTNNWLWEIENTGKNIQNIPEEETTFFVQVVINQSLQICLLTTWLNQDWGVVKFRNAELRSIEGVIYLDKTFGFLEEILHTIQEQLPKDQFFRCCTFCKYGTYETDTYAPMGDLLCMKNCKKQYMKIKTLRGFKGLLEREKEYIAKVNETHLCDQFERIDGLNWTYKNAMIEIGL
jgi:hypothetical protein